MKFQDDISNMNTHIYIRTSRNQYVPHFFKVGGIKKSGGGGGEGGGVGGDGEGEGQYLNQKHSLCIQKKKKKKK